MTEEKQSKKYKIVTAKELLESVIQEREWLVNKIIPENAIVLFGGEPESFKSFLSLYIAVFGAVGLKVLSDFDTKKFRVLYISEEMDEQELLRRLRKVTIGYGIVGEKLKLYFLFAEGIKLDYMNEESRKALIEVLQEAKPDLIICDSVVRMMTGDEDKAKDVRRIFDNIKQISREHNCSWLLIHHTRKNYTKKGRADIRGSGDFVAMVDEVFMVNRNDRTTFTLSKEKSRSGVHIDDVVFEVYNDERGGIQITKIREEPASKLTAVEVYAEQIWDWIQANDIKEFTRKMLQDSLKEPYDGITKAFGLLQKQGKITSKIRGRYVVVK